MDAVVDDPMLVNCRECSGLRSRVKPCMCLDNPGVKPALWRSLRSKGAAPYPTCNKCNGSGTVSEDCFECGGAGWLRAQIVVTVINADTGAVASAQVVPGLLTPARWAHTTRYELPIRPLADELAEQVDAAWVNTDGLTTLHLPDDYDPDLPQHIRQRMETTALALSVSRRRQVLIARSSKPQAAPGPDDKLVTWCRLAERLGMDLVVWRRGRIAGSVPGWYVGMALPGMPLPSGRLIGHRETLLAAVRSSDTKGLVKQAVHGVKRADMMRTPARFLNNIDSDSFDATSVGTVHDLGIEVDKRATTPQGAVAIWRCGGWHYSTVSSAGVFTDSRIDSTGQVVTSDIEMWDIETPPPEPSYWGEPIPGRGCDVCESGTPWTECSCVRVLTVVDPECDKCSGTGKRRTTDCSNCGDVGRINDGVVITVTDMDDYVRHVNLAPDAGANVARNGQQPRNPDLAVFQLPESYRLTTYLISDGVDFANVRTAFGGHVGQDLLSGTVMTSATATAAEVTAAWCNQAARTHPGGRNLLMVSPPRREKLSILANVAFAVGLDLVVGCQYKSLQRSEGIESDSGTRWGIILQTPTTDNAKPRMLLPNFRYLAAAVGDHLDHIATRTDHPPHATVMLPVPNRPTASPSDARDIDSIEPVLTRLAKASDFDTITIRLNPQRVTIIQHTFGPARDTLPEPDLKLAQGSTVTAAISKVS